MSSTDSDAPRKGVSLARGPALILGTVLLVAGLYFLYKLHSFPKLSQFPSGRAHVEGKAFLGVFGVNGWSGELTAAAGGVLLIGAAQHLLAKTMSMIVGVLFAVIAILALVNHHSALGLFAANIWTIILWAGSSALLLINTLMPRHGAHTVTTDAYIREPVQTPTARPVEHPSETLVASQPPAPTVQTETGALHPEGDVVSVRSNDESSPPASAD